MIEKTKIFMFLLFFSSISCFSQTLSNQVMLPAAGLATAGVMNYSQTIGETAVEIMTGAGFYLTQGFQQPGMDVETELAHSGTGVEVYPNPATDFIRIKLFGDNARKFRIEIISLTGMIASSTNLEFITKYYYIQQIDINKLTIGFYFVRVTSSDGIIKRIFKFEKM